MPRNEDYPGQNYFHQHNENIRRAESNAIRFPKIRYVDVRDRATDFYVETKIIDGSMKLKLKGYWTYE